jgi:hypothetical protein
MIGMITHQRHTARKNKHIFYIFVIATGICLWRAWTCPPAIRNARNTSFTSDFVIGINTVNRPGRINYLQATLHTLFCALDKTGSFPPVVLFNGEVPPTAHTALSAVKKDPIFLKLQEHGLVVKEAKQLHKELQQAMATGGLPSSHGDSPSRIWWRSKEALDTAMTIELSLHHAPSAKYYIHMQDDIRVAGGFLQELHKFISHLPGACRYVDFVSLYSSGDFHRKMSYEVLDGTTTGMVAFSIPVRMAKDLSMYIKSHFYISPVDWLLANFRDERRSRQHVIIPNLVEHMGRFSTLHGKTHNLSRGSSTFKPCGC